MFFNLFGSKKNKAPAATSAGKVVAAGLTSIKDIVAPSFIEVDFNHLKIGDKYYRTLFVVGYPRFVSSNWLYPIITFDHPLYISMFIYPTQSKDILKDLKRKIAEMEATIESDMKAGKVVDPSTQVALDDALTLQEIQACYPLSPLRGDVLQKDIVPIGRTGEKILLERTSAQRDCNDKRDCL